MKASVQHGAEAPPQRSPYLLILIAVAIGILVAGVSFRPKHAAPPPISESEALRLQMQAQRRDLERRTLLFATRARDLAPVAEQARTRPASVPWAQQVGAGQRLLVLAPSPSGEPRWLEAAVAGVIASACDGVSADQIALSATLPPSLQAGAAFDLDNQLAGIVADCGSGNVLLTPSAFEAYLAQAPARVLLRAAGLRIREETGRARVLEVRRNSVSAELGLQPGDLITQVNGSAPGQVHDLAERLMSPDVEVQAQRDGPREAKTLTLRSATLVTPSGVRWQKQSRQAEVASLAPGSAAVEWGLQSGDVVLRAGSRRNPTPAAVDQVLSGNDGEKTDIVVLRGNAELLLEGPK